MPHYPWDVVLGTTFAALALILWLLPRDSDDPAGDFPHVMGRLLWPPASLACFIAAFSPLSRDPLPSDATTHLIFLTSFVLTVPAALTLLGYRWMHR